MAAARGALGPAAIHVLTAVDRVTFAEVRDGATLLGRARGTVTDGRLGLFAIETASEARRRGIAAAMICRLAGWARDLGATSAYLQVEETNTAARALYCPARLQHASPICASGRTAAVTLPGRAWVGPCGRTGE